MLDESLLDKNRKLNPKDKKTDWFYQNEEFDRRKGQKHGQGKRPMHGRPAPATK